ncbi:MAG TPA: hypothetical protein VFI35_13680 [Actinomycetota bacterium]|nr:hypothetical protein [Actinomycetota bacterium]
MLRNLLATGHTWSGGGGGFSLIPVFGVIVSIALARSVLAIRLSIPLAASSVFLGTVFAIVADIAGLTIATSMWFLSAVGIASVIRLGRGSLPRNTSD